MDLPTAPVATVKKTDSPPNPVLQSICHACQYSHLYWFLFRSSLVPRPPFKVLEEGFQPIVTMKKNGGEMKEKMIGWLTD